MGTWIPLPGGLTRPGPPTAMVVTLSKLLRRRRPRPAEKAVKGFETGDLRVSIGPSVPFDAKAMRCAGHGGIPTGTPVRPVVIRSRRTRGVVRRYVLSDDGGLRLCHEYVDDRQPEMDLEVLRRVEGAQYVLNRDR